MIQVVPLATRTHRNTSPLSTPTTAPAPVRVAVPSAPTEPPYTVKTVCMASTSPCSEVTRSGGSTTRTARIGTTYITSCPIPARAIATGMSRLGSTISSPAVAGSSMPTNE